MIYKRHEAFRYEFGVPLEAELSLVKMENKEIHTNPGMILIHDISPEGMKIISQLDIPLEPKFTLKITLTLIEKISLLAEIAWKKECGNGYMYGLKLQVDANEKTTIVKNLKDYVKQK